MFGLPRATADGFFNEGFMNNTCIVNGEGVYFKVWEEMGALLPNTTGLRFPVTTHGNRLYGNLSVCAGACGMSGCVGTPCHHSIEEWLALGQDPGTTLVSAEVPPVDTIVGWARAMLAL